MVANIYDNAFYGCDLLKSLEVASGTNTITNEGVILKHIGIDVFNISAGVNNQQNITLTIGANNSLNIQENTLTVKDNSYMFKKIIVTGR